MLLFSRYFVAATTSSQRPLWHAAVLRMHGSTRHATLPCDAHDGFGSFARSARHTHGASPQYDENVRQSASVLHVPLGADADNDDDAADADDALDVLGEVVDVVAEVVALGDDESLGALLLLQAATPRIDSAAPMTIVRAPVRALGRFRLCGAEGDRTPDLIHAMDALSQLSYGPEKSSGWGVSYFGNLMLSSAPVRARPDARIGSFLAGSRDVRGAREHADQVDRAEDADELA